MTLTQFSCECVLLDAGQAGGEQRAAMALEASNSRSNSDLGFSYSFDFARGPEQHARERTLFPGSAQTGKTPSLASLTADVDEPATLGQAPAASQHHLTLDDVHVAGAVAASRAPGVPLHAALRPTADGAAEVGDSSSAAHRHQHPLPETAPCQSSGPSAAPPRGIALKAFAHAFEHLDSKRQLMWFSRAKEQLERLWQCAHVAQADRQLFRKAHCLGGMTVSKALALALHLQVLVLHMQSKTSAWATLVEREKCLKLLRSKLQAFSEAKAAYERVAAQRPRPAIGQDDEWHTIRRTFRAQVRVMLLSLLRLTISFTEHLREWRTTLWRPQPFLWRGRNYVEKMARDTKWLVHKQFDQVWKAMNVPADEVSVCAALCAEEYGRHAPTQPAQATELGKEVNTPGEGRLAHEQDDSELLTFKDKVGKCRVSIGNRLKLSTLPVDSATVERIDAALCVIADEHALQRRLRDETKELAERGAFVPIMRWRLKHPGNERLALQIARRREARQAAVAAVEPTEQEHEPSPEAQQTAAETSPRPRVESADRSDAHGAVEGRPFGSQRSQPGAEASPASSTGSPEDHVTPRHSWAPLHAASSPLSPDGDDGMFFVQTPKARSSYLPSESSGSSPGRNRVDEEHYQASPTWRDGERREAPATWQSEEQQQVATSASGAELHDTQPAAEAPGSQHDGQDMYTTEVPEWGQVAADEGEYEEWEAEHAAQEEWQGEADGPLPDEQEGGWGDEAEWEGEWDEHGGFTDEHGGYTDAEGNYYPPEEAAGWEPEPAE